MVTEKLALNSLEKVAPKHGCEKYFSKISLIAVTC